MFVELVYAPHAEPGATITNPFGAATLTTVSITLAAGGKNNAPATDKEVGA